MASDAGENDCPLPASLQTRNLVCFAALWCLIYLTGPISYVGVTHANLLRGLGNSDTVNNLPQAMYQWMSGVSVVVAWLLPHPRWLKPLLIGSLAAKTAVTIAVAATIWLQLPTTVVSVTVVAHGGVFGAANSVQIMTLWELVRRGVATGRRGALMGWTFGFGPLLGPVGSIAQQVLLGRDPITGYTLGIPFPDNYMTLFAGAIPVLVASIGLGAAFIVPPPTGETIPTAGLADIYGGLRQFVTTKAVLMCAIAYVLVYSGGRAIMDNVSLHARDVMTTEFLSDPSRGPPYLVGQGLAAQGATAAGSLGGPAQLLIAVGIIQTGAFAPDTVGVQNFLRFSFKAIAGVLLGYLLAKTHPKATLLATTGLLLLGMGWALEATGWWYVVTLGWLGAGELFGAYYFNYISTASAKSRVRVNIAYVNLMTIVVGFAAVMYGQISDHYGRPASFYVASGILIFALLLVVFTLPARPTPNEDSPRESQS